MRLASQKAFRVGLKKVGLDHVVLVCNLEEPISTTGVDVAQLEQAFVKLKWRRKRQRTAPL